MKGSLITLLFLCLSVFSQAQNKEILWKEGSRLSWDDFKAKPEDASHGKAKTVYKIDIVPVNVSVDEKGNIVNYKKITAVAVFVSNMSWSKRKIENSNLLKHEQLHFDIAELFARKIRLKFKELQNRKEKRFSIYQQEYTKLWKACRLYQKKYDKETYHGILIDTNKKWVAKVEQELLLIH